MLNLQRRELLLAAAMLAASRAAWAMPAPPPIHAQVPGNSKPLGGVPQFAGVGEALAAAPRDGKPYRIRIGHGLWHEKLVIDVPRVELIGDTRARCILSYDAAAGMARPDGQAWGTWGCASLIVRAPGFVARNLTIENAFDYVGNLAQPKFEPIGPNGAQAVALMLDQGSDHALIQGCDILGHQDTLFADAGASHFQNCRITGSVDFIFGAGQVFVENSRIVSRFRPGKERQGYIAAPSTLAEDEHGIAFRSCRLERESEVPDGTVALGRAWRPTREFPDGRYGDPGVLGKSVFIDCWMDAHIAPQGWDPMAYTARDGRRVMLEPGEARLFESGSTGPGAHADTRRRQLPPEKLRRYPARTRPVLRHVG